MGLKVKALQFLELSGILQLEKWLHAIMCNPSCELRVANTPILSSVHFWPERFFFSYFPRLFSDGIIVKVCAWNGGKAQDFFADMLHFQISPGGFWILKAWLRNIVYIRPYTCLAFLPYSSILSRVLHGVPKLVSVIKRFLLRDEYTDFCAKCLFLSQMLWNFVILNNFLSMV